MSEEGQKRLPRFKRANAGRLQITDRDISILTYVHKYHFLSSNHIASLAGGSSQQIRRRLQLLFHNGYLERPKAQLDYFAQSGTQPMVYGLGTKGAQLISKYNKRAEGARDWSYKNK